MLFLYHFASEFINIFLQQENNFFFTNENKFYYVNLFFYSMGSFLWSIVIKGVWLKNKLIKRISSFMKS